VRRVDEDAAGRRAAGCDRVPSDKAERGGEGMGGMSATALATRDLFSVPFADTIARSANLSRCGAYRFTLTRTWSSEGGRVCLIGLNPSTADHLRDDPTVRRWIHLPGPGATAGSPRSTFTRFAHPRRPSAAPGRSTWTTVRTGTRLT
jgi:hypothetical protein